MMLRTSGWGRAARGVLLALVGLGWGSACLSKGDTKVIAGGKIGSTECQQYCSHVGNFGCDAGDSCIEQCTDWTFNSEAYYCSGIGQQFISCMQEKTVNCIGGEPEPGGCASILEELEDCRDTSQCASEDDLVGCLACCQDARGVQAEDFLKSAVPCLCAGARCGGACAGECDLFEDGTEEDKYVLWVFSQFEECQACIVADTECSSKVPCAGDSCAEYASCSAACNQRFL